MANSKGLREERYQRAHWPRHLNSCLRQSEGLRRPGLGTHQQRHAERYAARAFPGSPAPVSFEALAEARDHACSSSAATAIGATTLIALPLPQNVRMISFTAASSLGKRLAWR